MIFDYSISIDLIYDSLRLPVTFVIILVLYCAVCVGVLDTRFGTRRTNERMRQPHRHRHRRRRRQYQCVAEECNIIRMDRQ